MQIINYHNEKALLIDTDDLLLREEKTYYAMLSARKDRIKYILIISSLPFASLNVRMRILLRDELQLINCFRCEVKQ